MHMYGLIKFDRPIIRGTHIISIGGFEMTFNNGKTVQFDFLSFNGHIESDDPCVLNFELGGLDVDAFPDSEFLKTFTGKVTAIKEFYVYTGETGDPEINPVELKALFLYNHHSEQISIDRSLLKGVFSKGKNESAKHLKAKRRVRDCLHFKTSSREKHGV